MIRYWIEAMRLRTLPVSVAGVIVGTACAIILDSFKAVPAIACLLFAILAQIAANFGNEYYDYKNGIDRKGRAGFRRGVTEGEIDPKSMKRATFIVLALAAAVGCTMLLYGPWWLIIVGVLIIIFALAYSAGPYPLSHHGLGDLAVIIFFGFIPVTFTCFLQTGDWEGMNIILPASLTVGLLAANVLIVNNYRDMEDDAAVGKRTTVVIFGRRCMSLAYLLSGIAGMAIMIPVWIRFQFWGWAIPIVYITLHLKVWLTLRQKRGAALNPLLGRTAVNLLVFSLLLLCASSSTF